MGHTPSDKLHYENTYSHDIESIPISINLRVARNYEDKLIFFTEKVLNQWDRVELTTFLQHDGDGDGETTEWSA